MNGAEHELGFWQAFVTSEQFATWLAPTPTPELEPLVRDFLLARPEALVLDVGSGVVSVLHGTVPAARLTAADPLSADYQNFFDYDAHGLLPPLAVAVEKLEFDALFDVVHMRNALDHSEDPAEGMRRLLRATRPGGWVIVQGFKDEGATMGWRGMHQWNLRTQELELVALDRVGSFTKLGRATRVYPMYLDSGRSWFVWMKQKAAA